MELIDFSDCKIRTDSYGYLGANGKKVPIEYNGRIYMLKFHSLIEKADMKYSNSVISEYISCNIFNLIGIKAQNTLLGIYKKDGKEQIVCACEDFTQDGAKLIEFAGIKNSVLLDSDSNGYGVELNEILKAIEEQQIIEQETVKNFFWKMFIVDSLLGNFDRHNGNWGFLINNETKEATIAPIYDCGSCLYPQISEELMVEVLKNEDERNKRIYTFPNSALRINDNKINYFDFINSLENQDCNNALKKIYPLINIDKINLIIDDLPLMSDERKNFYKCMIKERFELIIENSYYKLLKQEKTIENSDEEEDER